MMQSSIRTPDRFSTFLTVADSEIFKAFLIQSPCSRYSRWRNDWRRRQRDQSTTFWERSVRQTPESRFRSSQKSGSESRITFETIWFTLFLYAISIKMLLFCRAMLCKRGRYRHAVSVYPSVCVCPSRSWIMSKRINISSKCFHHRVATPF